jgi:hypothetical protein
MKHLKRFEESKYDIHIKNLLKNTYQGFNKSDESSPYKIGDLVRVKDLEDKIFVITIVKKKSRSPFGGEYYFTYDTDNIDPDDEDGWGWTEENNLMPVSDSEYKKWVIKKAADKYNL